MVRCYWCISILIIIPTIRCCSLTGPLCGWSAVVLSDRRYSSFWNFDSTISVDVLRMKSYMDSLLDPTCVSVRITINKLNFFPNRKMPRFVKMLLPLVKICYLSPMFREDAPLSNFVCHLQQVTETCRTKLPHVTAHFLSLYYKQEIVQFTLTKLSIYF